MLVNGWLTFFHPLHVKYLCLCCWLVNGWWCDLILFPSISCQISVDCLKSTVPKMCTLSRHWVLTVCMFWSHCSRPSIKTYISIKYYFSRYWSSMRTVYIHFVQVPEVSLIRTVNGKLSLCCIQMFHDFFVANCLVTKLEKCPKM